MSLRDAIAAGISHLAQDNLRAGLSILGILIGIATRGAKIMNRLLTPLRLYSESYR